MFGNERARRRNTVVASVSGILFACGWWLIIDAICHYPLSSDFNKIYLIIGVVSTLAFILTNSISNARVKSDADRPFGPRIFLFFSFVLAFGSLIASTWVLFSCYILSKKDKLYPGLALFGQNLVIFISTFIFKFGRKDVLNY